MKYRISQTGWRMGPVSSRLKLSSANMINTYCGYAGGYRDLGLAYNNLVMGADYIKIAFDKVFNHLQ